MPRQKRGSSISQHCPMNTPVSLDFLDDMGIKAKLRPKKRKKSKSEIDSSLSSSSSSSSGLASGPTSSTTMTPDSPNTSSLTSDSSSSFPGGSSSSSGSSSNSLATGSAWAHRPSVDAVANSGHTSNDQGQGPRVVPALKRQAEGSGFGPGAGAYHPSYGMGRGPMGPMGGMGMGGPPPSHFRGGMGMNMGMGDRPPPPFGGGGPGGGPDMGMSQPPGHILERGQSLSGAVSGMGMGMGGGGARDGRAREDFFSSGSGGGGGAPPPPSGPAADAASPRPQTTTSGPSDRAVDSIQTTSTTSTSSTTATTPSAKSPFEVLSEELGDRYLGVKPGGWADLEEKNKEGGEDSEEDVLFDDSELAFFSELGFDLDGDDDAGMVEEEDVLGGSGTGAESGRTGAVVPASGSVDDDRRGPSDRDDRHREMYGRRAQPAGRDGGWILNSGDLGGGGGGLRGHGGDRFGGAGGGFDQRQRPPLGPGPGRGPGDFGRFEGPRPPQQDFRAFGSDGRRPGPPPEFQGFGSASPTPAPAAVPAPEGIAVRTDVPRPGGVIQFKKPEPEQEPETEPKLAEQQPESDLRKTQPRVQPQAIALTEKLPDPETQPGPEPETQPERQRFHGSASVSVDSGGNVNPPSPPVEEEVVPAFGSRVPQGRGTRTRRAGTAPAPASSPAAESGSPIGQDDGSPKPVPFAPFSREYEALPGSSPTITHHTHSPSSPNRDRFEPPQFGVAQQQIPVPTRHQRHHRDRRDRDRDRDRGRGRGRDRDRDRESDEDSHAPSLRVLKRPPEERSDSTTPADQPLEQPSEGSDERTSDVEEPPTTTSPSAGKDDSRRGRDRDRGRRDRRGGRDRDRGARSSGRDRDRSYDNDFKSGPEITRNLFASAKPKAKPKPKPKSRNQRSEDEETPNSEATSTALSPDLESPAAGTPATSVDSGRKSSGRRRKGDADRDQRTRQQRPPKVLKIVKKPRDRDRDSPRRSATTKDASTEEDATEGLQEGGSGSPSSRSSRRKRSRERRKGSKSRRRSSASRRSADLDEMFEDQARLIEGLVDGAEKAASDSGGGASSSQQSDATFVYAPRLTEDEVRMESMSYRFDEGDVERENSGKLRIRLSGVDADALSDGEKVWKMGVFTYARASRSRKPNKKPKSLRVTKAKNLTVYHDDREPIAITAGPRPDANSPTLAEGPRSLPVTSSRSSLEIYPDDRDTGSKKKRRGDSSSNDRTSSRDRERRRRRNRRKNPRRHYSMSSFSPSEEAALEAAEAKGEAESFEGFGTRQQRRGKRRGSRRGGTRGRGRGRGGRSRGYGRRRGYRGSRRGLGRGRGRGGGGRGRKKREQQQQTD